LKQSLPGGIGLKEKKKRKKEKNYASSEKPLPTIITEKDPL